MPASSVQEAVQNQLMKWGFVAIIGLIGAGLLSLANRNVYSKEQVDIKLQAHNAVQQIQSQRMMDKLEVISDDVGEIKEQLKENK